MNVRVVPLADVTYTIPYLSELFVREWEPYYGRNGPGDATADLSSCCNRNALPVALVAMSDNGDVLGTAALKSDSVGAETAPGPWLAALVVATRYRNLGIASSLVKGIENEARRLRYRSIYVSTDAAENIVKRLGWTRIDEQANSLRGPVAIYHRQLAPSDKQR